MLTEVRKYTTLLFYFFALSKYKSTFDRMVLTESIVSMAFSHIFLWASWASFATSNFLFFFFFFFEPWPSYSSLFDDDARNSLSIFLFTASTLRSFGEILFAYCILLAIKVDVASIAVEVDGVAVWGERKAFLTMFFILWVKRSVDWSRYVCTTCPGKPASITRCFANINTSFHSLPWQWL